MHQNRLPTTRIAWFPYDFCTETATQQLWFVECLGNRLFSYDFCTFRVFQCTDYLISYQNRLVSLWLLHCFQISMYWWSEFTWESLSFPMTFIIFPNGRGFLKIAMNSYDFCIFQVPQCVDELLLYQNHSKSLIFPMTFELFLNINVLMIGFCMGIAWFPYDFLRIPKMNMGFFTKSLSGLANRLAIRSPEIA